MKFEKSMPKTSQIEEIIKEILCWFPNIISSKSNNFMQIHQFYLIVVKLVVEIIIFLRIFLVSLQSLTVN